jgi:hypothetical protein
LLKSLYCIHPFVIKPTLLQSHALSLRVRPQRAGLDNDINEWEIITIWPGISMQTNGHSCCIFASVRLEFWCNHRRFPKTVEFKQNYDEQFRLYMVKIILQCQEKDSRSHLYLLNRRKMIVHDLTDEERSIPIDLTTDDIDYYLS